MHIEDAERPRDNGPCSVRGSIVQNCDVAAAVDIGSRIREQEIEVYIFATRAYRRTSMP
jgi:hypothetical protein